MSYITPHLHTCLFCRASYWCEAAHVAEVMREGGRCCLDCRLRNLIDARKLRAGGSQ